MKKKILLSIVLVVALALLGIAAVSYLSYQNQLVYNATYIVIEGVEYERTVTALDLSGKPLQEPDKVKELSNLKTLNIRDTGITAGEYEQLVSALPDCQITWSIPFQGSFYADDTTSLEITSLSDEDLALIPYFRNLQSVQAENCTDYENLSALMTQFPELSVTYNVELGGTAYPSDADTLSIESIDPEEFREKIRYLPRVASVTLTGTIPDKDVMLGMKEEYPAITFDYNFEVLGIAVNSLDTFLDLSGMSFESTEEVEAILPYFYNLQQIDMVDCGFSNETMDELNKRHLHSTKFVWTVTVCGRLMRTDAKYFMPAKYKTPSVPSSECYNLRYCYDMEVVDLGHYGTSRVDFVEHMPSLKYLLLCESGISDLTAIGNCTSLEYLELQMTDATDYWPLTNLTNLRDLNLSGLPFIEYDEVGKCVYGNFGDYTPLLQLTWLDRFWLAHNTLTRAQRAEIYRALPDTVVIFESGGHTTGGFRYTPRYFEQRDILGMRYSAN